MSNVQDPASQAIQILQVVLDVVESTDAKGSLNKEQIAFIDKSINDSIKLLLPLHDLELQRQLFWSECNSSPLRTRGEEGFKRLYFGNWVTNNNDE